MKTTAAAAMAVAMAKTPLKPDRDMFFSFCMWKIG